MNVFELFVSFAVDDSDFNHKLSAAEENTRRTGRRMENEWDRRLTSMSRRLDVFGQQLQGIGRTMSLAVTTPIVAMGGTFIAAASDAEETSSKFATVFSDVGDEAEKAARRMRDSFGLSSTAAQALLGDTGDLLTGFGFTGEAALDLSTQVNELAVDLASFTNFSGGAEGASAALTKALLGETEAAKSLGIAITQDIVNARIEEMRQAGELVGLTERQERAYATLAIAQEQSKNAIGDFARTSDSFANQMRIMQARLNDLAVVFGQEVLPVATRFVGWLTETITRLADMESGTRRMILAVAGIAAGIGPALFALGTLARSVTGLIALFRTLRTVMLFLGPGGLVAGAVGIVASLGFAFAGRSDSLDTKAESAADSIAEVRDAIGQHQASGNLRGAIGELSGEVEGEAAEAWDAFAGAVEDAAQRAQAAGKTIADADTEGSIRAALDDLAEFLSDDELNGLRQWVDDSIASAGSVAEAINSVSSQLRERAIEQATAGPRARMVAARRELDEFEGRHSGISEVMQKELEITRELIEVETALHQARVTGDREAVREHHARQQVLHRAAAQANEALDEFGEGTADRLRELARNAANAAADYRAVVAEVEAELPEIAPIEIAVEPPPGTDGDDPTTDGAGLPKDGAERTLNIITAVNRDELHDAVSEAGSAFEGMGERFGLTGMVDELTGKIGVLESAIERIRSGAIPDATKADLENFEARISFYESLLETMQLPRPGTLPARDMSIGPTADVAGGQRGVRPGVTASSPTEAQAAELNRLESHYANRREIEAAHQQAVIQADREALQERRRLRQEETDQMLANWHATVENLARAGREQSVEQQQAAVEAAERNVQAAREAGQRIATSLADATAAGIEAEAARLEASAQASAQSLKNFQVTLENLARAGREGAAANAEAIAAAEQADLEQLAQDMDNFGASIENLARAGRVASVEQAEAQREMDERLDRVQKRRASLEALDRLEASHAAAEELGSQHRRAAQQITASNEALRRLTSSHAMAQDRTFEANAEVMRFGQGLEDLARKSRQATQAERDRAEALRDWESAAGQSALFNLAFGAPTPSEDLSPPTEELDTFGESLMGVAEDHIPFFGSALQGLAAGGPIGAVTAVFSDLLGESEGFANLMETLGNVIQPIISVLDGFFGAINRVVRWIFGIPDRRTRNQDPLPGSIGAKQQEIDVAREAFERATTESSREFYRQLIERLESELDEMREGVEPVDGIRRDPVTGEAFPTIAQMREQLTTLQEERDTTADVAERARLNQQIEDLQERIASALEEGLEDAGEDMGETVSGKIAELEEERRRLIEERDTAQTEEAIAMFNRQIATLEEELRRLRELGMEEAEARRRREQGFGGTPQAVQLAVATPLVDASVRMLDAGELFSRAVAPLIDGSALGDFSPNVQDFGGHINSFGRSVDRIDGHIDRFSDAVDRFNHPGINVKVHSGPGSAPIRRTTPYMHLRTTI